MEPHGGGGGAVMASPATSPPRLVHRRPRAEARPGHQQQQHREEEEDEDIIQWFFGSGVHPSESDYTSFHRLSFRDKVRPNAAGWRGALAGRLFGHWAGAFWRRQKWPG